MAEISDSVKLQDTAHRNAPERERQMDTSQMVGPAGLDIGTSNIVLARMKSGAVQTVKQLNAFFAVPRSKFTGKVFAKNEIMYFARNGQFYIIGNSSDTFAATFNSCTRRPIEGGLLSPKEDEGVNVIAAIMKTMLPPPKKPGEIIAFSVPGEPVDTRISVLYHETVMKRTLEGMGYLPISVNEGMAVITSEMSNDNYTGIGISMGGGMCNVCLAYMAVPILSFSIQKGGDYIDSMVGRTLGESQTKIKLIKEKDLSLTREPRNKVETALQIFYDDLLSTLVQSLEQVLASSDKVPRFSKPVPLVISGGGASAHGLKERFERALKGVSLPVQISSVRIAEDPLNSTAKGALYMALSEDS
ncbi:MAG: hypothetical protein H7844_10060 [Nitrospirae bacterium YQR-1]